ncbi:hypothetical protein Pla144_23240 [Bythopirellula polymerisocia]|uniref:Uncharacterized protein n=2 Tax=Bythopirellula polymerisocia TaxID=2528003 RepID=A0A5C6CVL3_9BACT|nr:hypothetical protein Pla144_23240 [Bythopirellula polymerisocia]
MPQAVVVLMLLWAMNPGNPYAYYNLLRVVCCGVFAYLAYKASDREKKEWAWVLGILALVYNPLFRVHLNRELWSLVNLVTIAIAIASAFALKVDEVDDNS